MDGLRKFIEVDNREAVNVGGLRQGTNSVKVLKPRFTADLLQAVCGRIDLEGRRSGHVEAERWTAQKWNDASTVGAYCDVFCS